MYGWFSEARSTWSAAVPLCLAEAANQLLSLVDIAFIGRASPAQIAGTSIGAGLFIIPLILGVGILMGIDPFVAQALGRGQVHEARRCLAAGLRCAFLVGIPLTVLPFAMHAVLPLFGIEARTRHEALAYLIGRAPSMWPALSVIALRSYLQAQHRGRVILVGVIVANVTNALFDYLFLFGDAGLHLVGLSALGVGLGQGYGVFGVGLASTFAVLAQGATLRGALGRDDLRGPRLGAGAVTPILRIGLPLGLQRLAEVGLIFVVGLLAGRMGADEQSAHYVAMQVVATAFTVAYGTAQAVAVRVGRSIGSDSVRDARRAALSGLVLISLLMGAAGLAMGSVPLLIAGSLAKPPSVVAATARLLRVAAVFQVADGIQIVAAGALRGIAATQQVFWLTLLSHWVVGLPIGLVLAFRFGMGVPGLWWGLTVAFTLASGLLTWALFSLLRVLQLVDRSHPQVLAVTTNPARGPDHPISQTTE